MQTSCGVLSCNVLIYGVLRRSDFKISTKPVDGGKPWVSSGVMHGLLAEAEMSHAAAC